MFNQSISYKNKQSTFCLFAALDLLLEQQIYKKSVKNEVTLNCLIERRNLPVWLAIKYNTRIFISNTKDFFSNFLDITKTDILDK